MKELIALITALCWVTVNCLSAEIQHEKLLPTQTVFLLTITDVDKWEEQWNNSPQGLLWKDPSMQPFKDKFVGKWKKEVVQPLENELGIKFADFSDLAKGQVTFGVTLSEQAQANEPKKTETGILLLVETRENKERLTKLLSDVAQKFTQSGKKINTNNIGGVSYYGFIINTLDITKTLEKVFPDPMEGWESLDAPKPKPQNKQIELQVGQIDSLLVMGTVKTDVEKITLAKSTKATETLENTPAFKQYLSSRPQNAILAGWLNTAELQKLVPFSDPNNKPNPMGFNITPQKVLDALGLFAVKSISFSTQYANDANVVEIFIQAPQNERKGFVKILSPDPNDCSPPDFVPTNAVSYTRIRINLQNAWSTIESALEQIDPKIPNVLNLMLQTAGKVRDPNFDWRKDLIGSLGDDIVVYKKNPAKLSVETLNTSPSLVLIGSSNPDKLASSIKFLTALSPKPPEIKETEIAGKKVSFWEEEQQGIGDKKVKRQTYLCAFNNYLAIANDKAILDEALSRSAGTASLKDFAPLKETAQKIGGMNSGLFSFVNSREQTRAQFQVLKSESDTIAMLLSVTPIGMRLGLGEDSKVFKEWVDVSLLPEFDKIAKYFYVTTTTLSSQKDGISIKIFTPVPPELKKN